MLDELHVYEDREPQSAPMNMAIDEALLEFAGAPSLRFYQWQRPSLSFGYFGRFADVADEQKERELVRRWTGGGIVLHGKDVTYSLILPSCDGRSLPSARAVYSQVHKAIRETLPARLEATLAASDAPKTSESCFANSVTADVLAAGKKIAGAAQRRTRAGLLHEGSVQHKAVGREFRMAFASALSGELETREFSSELLEYARELARRKYGTEEWLRRR